MDINNNEQGDDSAVAVNPDEITITLRKPVTVGKTAKSDGVTYDSLDLREPNAGELEKASKSATDIGVVLNLISLVAKVPRAVAEGLCQRDLKEASDFLARFNEDAPATGENASLS
ncbi:phage tail assembly protein [Duganella dendranthematis]|uniref:Phage tail assembly protein n=1 Tax=Duganella dendranthematis TaxID=2728021 RepID=A0ABX6MBU4_9BURK|nr:phage tail assembly protein [Duganella dendranthematis]QJD91806.1 phage tail assembly protein [Duganella dendranthematis]